MPLFTLGICRKNAGYSQKQAAKLLNICSSTLSKYEQDSSDIPVSLLRQMIKLYDVPLEYIFLGNQFELIRTKGEQK